MGLSGAIIKQTNVMICQCWFLPLAVCISIQGPARWGGRPLICDTEDLQALPLWTTAAMARQHWGVHTLPWWVLEVKNISKKKENMNIILLIFGRFGEMFDV